MLAFKVLHILSMFAAVTFLLGESTYLAVAIWRRDVKALAAIRRVAGRRPLVGALIFLIGIGLGLLTAATGGLDFFAGWLIAAYVMVVVLLGLSGLPVIQKGLLGLADKAVDVEAGRRPAEEVIAEMATLRRGIGLVVAANWLLFGAIIVDMIVKPF
jgi:hypothetical protein